MLRLRAPDGREGERDKPKHAADGGGSSEGNREVKAEKIPDPVSGLCLLLEVEQVLVKGEA